MNCRLRNAVLATPLMSAACSDATAPETGTVLVRVQTSADAKLDGLIVIVDEGARVQLSTASRTAVVTLPAGLHTLRIENVPVECAYHANLANSVMVRARGRIQVTFMLVCHGVAFPGYPPGICPYGCWDDIALPDPAGRPARPSDRDVR